MKSIIMLRGLPGSGKSSLATLLAEDGKYPIRSVDSFFTDQAGKYTFRFENNHLAYKACEENVHNDMLANVEKIFIDNTFTMEWEMEPYFNMAVNFGYRVFVITVENRHGTSNIHQITEEQIQKMREKFKVIL